MELPRALAELPVDHERLFGEAAERISRLVGDLCVIAVVSGPGGRFEPVAVSHPDPEVRAIVEQALQAAEFRPEDWPLASEALERGGPLLMADPVAARLNDRVNSWIRPYLERVEVRSLLFLPVRARGRTIGIVALAREGGSAPYTPDDQAIVSGVVDRVALTLDNARLVRTLRRQGELDAALLAVQSDLGEGIAVLDLDSERIVHANDAFGSMLGYRPAELERLPSFLELFDPEAHPPVAAESSAEATLEERLSAESPLGRRTLVLRRKNGERVEAEVATKRLEAAGGNRLVTLVRDVTERNRNEREALLRAELLDEVNAAVIRTDAVGTVLHWNRGAERLYGRSREDAVGRAARELLLPAPERHGRGDDVRRAIAERGAFEGEQTVVRPDGTTVPVDVRVATTGDGGLVAVAVDASERRRAQRELEQSREKFRAQYKGLPIPTYTWRSAGEDFVLIDYNDAADRFTEGHVAGLLGTRASQLYGHDPLIIAELKESLVARGSVSRELDFPMPSIGETKRLAFTYVYVPPNIVMVHAEDVTARRTAEAELRFQAELLDQVGAAVVACDLEGIVTHWNRGAAELFGLRAADAVGRSVVAIVSHLDIEEREPLLEQIRAAQAFEAEVRLRRDGKVVPVYLRTAPITDADGERAGHVGISVDVTERQLAERALHEAEERYRSLVERLPAITYVRDLGPSGRWRYVSPQIGSMLGYTPEEWEADPELWQSLLHPEDRERVLAAMARAEAAGEPLAVEYRIAGRDGDVRWLRHEAVVRREASAGGRTEGLLTDITERKRFESQLQFLADHDALTELYNRRRFVQELAREVRLVDRGQGTACVLMLDIDNFKYINDSLGHQAGDSLIRSVAGVLRRRVRASDTLARLGGDEFAMLLRGTTAHEALRVAGELLADIRDRWHPVAAEPVRVTASVGLAELEPGATAEGALAAADLAMYEAKHHGRDRYAVFSPELHARAEAGRSLTEQIRTALERDRFVLYAQPVIDLRTGAVAQHELLIRMLGEGDQLLAPGTFLPTAERFDLVQGIDRWVIGHAIALIAERGRRSDRIRLGVNLSGRSIADPALTRFLGSELERHSVEPADLVLEVTETAAIANMDQARDFAERVARLGCRLALDDFGSGFGSFYYLKYMPVHYLKIDGDFVRKLPTGRIDREVVRAIVKLAGSVGTGTMAEFVGDEQTLDLVRELGVDYAQGYHVGRPRPVAEL